MSIRFQADADLNQIIVLATIRLSMKNSMRAGPALPITPLR